MRAAVIVMLAFAALLPHRVRGQQPAPIAPSPEESVELNFPQEIDIKGFIDYVSDRLGIKILYDEQVANKKITIRRTRQSPG